MDSWVTSIIDFLRSGSADFLRGLLAGAGGSCVVFFFILRSRVKEYQQIIKSKDVENKALLQSKDNELKSFLQAKDTEHRIFLESKETHYQTLLTRSDLMYRENLESKESHYQTMLKHKDEIIAELNQKCENLQLSNKVLLESTTKALYGIDINDVTTDKKT